MSEATIAELEELRARVRASEQLLMELFLWIEKHFRTGHPIPSLSWRENGGLREAVERFAAYGPAEFAAMLAAQWDGRADAQALPQTLASAQTFRAAGTIRLGEAVVAAGSNFVLPYEPSSKLPPIGFAQHYADIGCMVVVEMSGAQRR